MQLIEIFTWGTLYCDDFIFIAFNFFLIIWLIEKKREKKIKEGNYALRLYQIPKVKKKRAREKNKKNGILRLERERMF